MPTVEERAEDRALRGFANFDTLKQLQDWTIGEVDDLQRANIPLLQRPKDIPEAIKKPHSSNIMLMNDYRGGYLHNGYEGCQGAIVKGEDYVLEQWQRVEAFSYFSHCRASIPPPSWVNAGHRNGALVLGTISLENDDDEPKLMLDKNLATNDYWFAERLFQMAKHYGFDGWLLNLELNHPNGKWVKGKEYMDAWNNGTPFIEMLTSLKSKLASLPGGGKLIWYDAHTTANPFKHYANTLDTDNRGIAEAAGSIVTNYWWDLAREVEPAVSLAKKSRFLSLSTVYFGTESWAQTADSKDGTANGRRTYGLNEDNGTFTSGTGRGHGGTATGLAVKPLAERGLGTGIFASGWAYEHWNTLGGGRIVDRYMWDGLPDPKKAGVPSCACHIGLDQHILDEIHKSPIARYATQYPVGSESFFYTDFTEASYHQSGTTYNMNITQQSVLPTPDSLSNTLTVSPEKTTEAKIGIHLAKEPSLRPSIYIFVKAGAEFSANTRLHGGLLLYHCSVRADLKLDLSIVYRRPRQNPGIVVKLAVQVGSKFENLDLPYQPQWNTLTLPLPSTKERITSIRFLAQGPAQSLGQISTEGSSFSLLEISSICLKPTGQSYPTNIRIQNFEVLQKGKDQTFHHRLKWSYSSVAVPNGFLMPWSDVTGPFSHFEIRVEKQLQGRAHSLQFIFDELQYQVWLREKKKVHVDITGYAFDGTVTELLKDQEITLV